MRNRESVNDNPHPVTRGLKLHPVFIGLDSLYLVIEYPRADLFEKWVDAIDDHFDVRLNEGIHHNGLVVRRGGNGYKISVWDGDARIYLTDRVDEKLVGGPHEGQGMGALVQVGPKWLRKYGDRFEEIEINVFGQLHIFGIDRPEIYPIRLNRIDIAVDIVYLPLCDFSTDYWRDNWVGYAHKMKFHTGSDSKKLETINIGTGQGSVAFRLYDKIAESTKDQDLRFWQSVWGIKNDEGYQVARFEWSIRCYKGGFSSLRYLNQLTEAGIHGLLQYAVEKWGRLCSPQENDSNQSRRAISPLWLGLKDVVNDWIDGNVVFARRQYDFRTDMPDSYLNSFSGWYAGLLVRIGIENYLEGPAGFGDALTYLQERGFTPMNISQRAQKKWTVVEKLEG